MKRKNIVLELMATEKSFVQSMGITITHYMKPLEQNCANFGEAPETIKQIFGDINIIYGFNVKLCAEMDKIVSSWTDESEIGPTFKRMAPFLKMYTAYSNKYSTSMVIYHNLMNRNEKFVLEVAQCRENSGSQLKLADLLIMPIQRIPRYSLLLRDLLENTSPDHKDYASLSESLNTISEVANHINEEVRRTENARKVEMMNEKGIKLTSIILPHRNLLKEGVVKVEIQSTNPYCPGKPIKESQQFLLFNDIFIHVRKDIIKHEQTLDQPQYVWPLILIWLTIEDKKVVMYGPGEIMTFADIEGEDTWQKAFEEAIKNQVNFKNSKSESKKHISTLSVRYGQFTFPNSQGSYEGQWVDGKREGKGTFSYGGNTYSGYWKADKHHGKGRYQYSNGDVYIGYWDNGLQQGKGQLKTADSSFFVGNWNKGLREAKGVIRYANGTVFRGEWLNDKINGLGELNVKDGFTYVGYWQENLFHGYGRLAYPNLTVYEGEWFCGSKQGTGDMKYTGGARYRGQWKDDMRHGTGTFIDYDKSKYEGEWVRDLQEGQGTKIWCDGVIYEGSWKGNYRNGLGKCTFPNRSWYEGNWENDRRHGEGDFHDVDDTVYSGTWIRDFPEGKGVMTFATGAVYKGLFVAGQFHKTGVYKGAENEIIESYEGEWLHGKMNGKGLIKYRNGDSYKGGFKNGFYDGNGTYTFANASSYEGKWKNGVKEGKLSVITPDLTSNGLIALQSPNLVIPSSVTVTTVIHVSPGLPTLPELFTPETTKSARR
jgi:hypothetical protein